MYVCVPSKIEDLQQTHKFRWFTVCYSVFLYVLWWNLETSRQPQTWTPKCSHVPAERWNSGPGILLNRKISSGFSSSCWIGRTHFPFIQRIMYIYIYLEPRTILLFWGYSKKWHSLIREPFFNKCTFFGVLLIIRDEGSFEVQAKHFWVIKI